MFNFLYSSRQPDFAGQEYDSSALSNRSASPTLLMMSPHNTAAPGAAFSSAAPGGGSLKDLAFAELDPQQSVLIHTANSIYQLDVTDLAERRVRIKGGFLGEQAIEVYFDWRSTHLRVGSCAFFFFQTKSDGVLRLMTSRIRGLSIINTVK